MTKSERKKFREEERMRLSKLMAEGVGSSDNTVGESTQLYVQLHHFTLLLRICLSIRVSNCTDEGTNDKPLLRRPGSTMPTGSNNADLDTSGRLGPTTVCSILKYLCTS